MSHPDPTKNYPVQISKCCKVTLIGHSDGHDEVLHQCPLCHQMEPETISVDPDDLEDEQFVDELL